MASGALVMGALKVVGGVMAAKSAVEGIKEGNLLKAALGGVGAYMSFSGLTSAASGGLEGEILQTTGTEVGEAMADQIVETTTGNLANNSLNTVAQGVSSAASPEMMNAASGLANKSTGLLESFGTGITNAAKSTGDFLERLGSNGIVSSNGVSGGGFDVFGKGGLLGDSYAKGQLISGGMQLAGGYMEGNAMEEREKWQLAQQERMYEEQRKRRGYTANQDFLSNKRWNPQTGTFEPVTRNA